MSSIQYTLGWHLEGSKCFNVFCRVLWLMSSYGKLLVYKKETLSTTESEHTLKVFSVLCLGSKPNYSKTGGKKGLKIIQDPNYHRYGNKLDMDSALESFIPHRSDSFNCYFSKDVTVCKTYMNTEYNLHAVKQNVYFS